MPTLNLFTNLPVDAVVASDILKDATKAVAKIIGKPESVKSHSFVLLMHLRICVCNFVAVSSVFLWLFH
ncbi:hypothetical protein CJ030_MR0G007715 [Morella rubra]|uniref:Uncharacterized protein n=1 Tax=Morella rubra TaxID=262757 RepID=A0A6A1UIK8_9ROSI|nr:hypothetical protein CJ030_MR0G007715 [Morella rubra]